ncbi:MAG: hypothetical protein JNJ78_11895 [Anaerolineae bacterium]|mgnify:CR=1 FL=1|nr:hypothetical protein [Anaerolineae bacterium]
MAEWQVQIIGHKHQLTDLLDLFQSVELSVKFEAESSEYYFTSSRLNTYTVDEIKEVHDIASAMLHKMNAIARLRYGGFESVRLGNMAYVADDGLKSHYVSGNGAVARVRVRSNLTVTLADGTVINTREKRQAQAKELLNLLDRDEDVTKSLELYGKLNHSWRNLYLVLETVEKAVGGQGNLLKQTWLTDISGMKEAIELFKHTSNSYAAIGAEARHAKESIIPPETPMTIDEARTVIRTLLNEWVKTKL